MSNETKTLGLISSPLVNSWGGPESDFNYEERRIIEAGREMYGNVLLINPFLVALELPRGDDIPRLLHDGASLPTVHSLVIRSTQRLGDGLAATVRALALRGCDILDPLTRQGHGRGSKLTTSIRRFRAGVGSSTFLAFSRSAALDLAGMLAEDDRFPLIAKPVSGTGGRGIVRLDSPDELRRHVRDFYRKKKKATLLLQPFERFVNEFRVITFFGEPLGIAHKTPAEGAVAANAALGGTFRPVDRPDVVEYACRKSDKTGILGIDVGETEDGSFRIIEANRAPKWQAFDKALGCNTARTIVTLARRRIDSRS